MCIICVSEKGIKQPTMELIETMFATNPDGAGYMVAEDGRVRISKGYMTIKDLKNALNQEHFKKDDVVVYHFRISTQAGVQPAMTQPFPYTNNIKNTRALDCIADLGIAHNGIIRQLSNPDDKTYSDTAHFTAEFLPEFIGRPEDLTEEFLVALARVTNSRFAFLDGTGTVYYSGQFIEDYNGLKFSNTSYTGYRGKTISEQKRTA